MASKLVMQSERDERGCQIPHIFSLLQWCNLLFYSVWLRDLISQQLRCQRRAGGLGSPALSHLELRVVRAKGHAEVAVRAVQRRLTCDGSIAGVDGAEDEGWPCLMDRTVEVWCSEFDEPGRLEACGSTRMPPVTGRLHARGRGVWSGGALDVPAVRAC